MSDFALRRTMWYPNCRGPSVVIKTRKMRCSVVSRRHCLPGPAIVEKSFRREYLAASRWLYWMVPFFERHQARKRMSREPPTKNARLGFGAHVWGKLGGIVGVGAA